MKRIGLVTYLSTTLNQGHFLGRGSETIILPVLARDEELQITTQESMFNFVRRSSGGNSRHKEPRSEVDIIIDIARDGIGKIEWEQFKSHDAIRELLEKCLSGFQSDKEHQIDGRTFHSPLFATESGKAKAHKVRLREVQSGTKFRLMTIRSEGQFNTVVYEEEDAFREQTRRDIVMMHKDDIDEIGAKENDEVTVRGASGRLRVIVRQVDIAKGNCAMYFPEANILLSHDVDEESRTPIYKGSIVQIESI